MSGSRIALVGAIVAISLGLLGGAIRASHQRDDASSDDVIQILIESGMIDRLNAEIVTDAIVYLDPTPTERQARAVAGWTKNAPVRTLPIAAGAAYEFDGVVVGAQAVPETVEWPFADAREIAGASAITIAGLRNDAESLEAFYVVQADRIDVHIRDHSTYFHVWLSGAGNPGRRLAALIEFGEDFARRGHHE